MSLASTCAPQCAKAQRQSSLAVTKLARSSLFSSECANNKKYPTYIAMGCKDALISKCAKCHACLPPQSKASHSHHKFKSCSVCPAALPELRRRPWEPLKLSDVHIDIIAAAADIPPRNSNNQKLQSSQNSKLNAVMLPLQSSQNSKAAKQSKLKLKTNHSAVDSKPGALQACKPIGCPTAKERCTLQAPT